MCMKLKFDHTNKWYMYNPESVLQNEMHKVLWDFEIQTYHQISVRQQDLIIINEKRENLKNCGLVPVDHRVKLKECEKRNKYIDLARELKKKLEHESVDYTNCNWCPWYSHRRVGSRTGGIGNNATGGGCPNYNIVEIGHNTEKRPWDLRRLAVTQTQVEEHLLTLMWKKLTNLPSLRKNEWRRVKAETEKVNQVLTYASTIKWPN